MTTPLTTTVSDLTPAAPAPRAVRRLVLRVATLLLGLAALFGLSVGTASASVNIGGNVFTTNVTCGGSIMTVTTSTTLNTSSSYAYLQLVETATGASVAESSWSAVNTIPQFRMAGFTFNRAAYFRVIAHYAQYTTAGWKYSAEYLTTFGQTTPSGTYRSTTCYMNPRG